MSTVWIICGAGKGVGKTHLALHMCDVLPKSAYAKLGCGPRKPEKPDSFFTNMAELRRFLEGASGRFEHIVVEGNRPAKEGMGDVVIYVGGSPRGATRPDAEELRTLAHIDLSRAEMLQEWERLLYKRLCDAALTSRLIRLFAEQSGCLWHLGIR